MKIFHWLLVSFVLVGYQWSGFALDPRDYTVEVTAQVQSSPPQIVLRWPASDTVRQYIIRRKNPQDGSWSGPIATLPGNATSFTDSQVSAGNQYEYEIEAPTSFYPWPNGDPAKWVTAWGYINAGIEVTLRDSMGKVLLLVDSSVAGPLEGPLQTFALNLVGAGWQVVRRDVARTTPVSQIRSIVQAEYNADPSNFRSVILFGHVPVPYSGAINPDMHEGHRGAWPADVVYADVNGGFSDNSVNISNSENPANNNVPGDGKFDQSNIPSPVELEIGRIDMWGLSEFNGRSEIDLLRRYLEKNHAFRHKQFPVNRRALIRDNFGDLDGDAPAVDAWRLFPSMVGSDKIQVVDAGQFFPQLNSDSYLWAYGGGGGGYEKADGVGTTADFAANDPKAIFYILHGSYFGDFDNENNFLRAATAVQNYGLASIWSGLPHWYMHHLSLGQTLGYSTKVSQNNVGLYKSHLNFSPGQVHIGLIGDPTLQVFQVAPPSSLSGRIGIAATLSWAPSADPVTGYHVYYSQNEMGPYQRLTQSPITVTSFSQRGVSNGTHYYMVRAVKLESTASGSFYQASQGAFLKLVKDGTSTPELPVVTLSVDDNDAAEANANEAVLRLTRSIVTGDQLVVDLEISGNASNGTDYQTIPVSVAIGAGVSTAFIKVLPYADALKEGDENVQVTVKGSSTYNLGGSVSANIIIKDNYATQPPTISAIGDQTIDQNPSTGEIPFTVSDADTPAVNLAVTATSSNQTLLPNSNLVLGGSGNNRSIRLTPVVNQVGNAVITINVSDGTTAATRDFNVTVRAVNRNPIANGQSVQVQEDGQINIALSGSDPDGNPLTYSVVNNPQKGALSGTAPNLTYKPQANANGGDSFTFQVSDGVATSQLATVQINITPVNDAPAATAQSIELLEDGSKSIVLAGTDVDGDAVTFILKSQPQKGVLTGNLPNLIYKALTNNYGNDSFTFAVTDGKVESGAATVGITITPQNDSPVISSIPDQVLPKGSISPSIPFQVNDVDHSASTLILSARSSNETLIPSTDVVITGTTTNRSVTLKPNGNATGVSIITLRVSDGAAFSESSFELRVTDNSPRITGIKFSTNGMAVISFQGTPNASYRVHASASAPDQWQVIAQGTANNDGTAQATDSQAKNLSFRLYKIEWQ